MNLYGVSFEKVADSKVFYLKKLVRKGDVLVWTQTDPDDSASWLEFHSTITAKRSIFNATAAEISRYVKENNYAFLGQQIGDIPYREGQI